ncbi:olfactory receptor 52D1-like [Lampris incognitus]|uniref:olfactory receptor 52D1-like n=1 Tax=Lampris incognitus TaxID=2546036 RepID=UPI0024B5CB1F|nr:olfactory receptor 52D1-like [Lampris incognitus]
MGNNSEIVFVLQGLNETLSNRQVYFTLALLLYLLTILVNLALILTIVLERMLHEPMYIFLCNLCVNGILGASSFYPKLLHDLLADAHVITYGSCIAQIFAVYCYVFCEFTNLTLMAYDRYVAICKPLQYQALVGPQRVGQLLFLTWAFTLLETAVGVGLTGRLPICGVHIHKIFCTNWEVVKLACSDTMLNNIYGFLLTVSHVSQAALIAVSYGYIVRASLRSRDSRRKFMQTCLPHLVTLGNFTTSLVFDAMYSRYGNSSSLRALRNILAAQFLVVPPLLNPVVYGMKLQLIRTRLAQMFTPKVSAFG